MDAAYGPLTTPPVVESTNCTLGRSLPTSKPLPPFLSKARARSCRLLRVQHAREEDIGQHARGSFYSNGGSVVCMTSGRPLRRALRLAFQYKPIPNRAASAV